MKLYKHMATLLSITTAVATSTTGTTYRLETSNEDGVQDHEQDYQVYFYAIQAGGASSPTSQIKLQTSPDNSVWHDVVTSTELTADDTKVESKDASTTPLLRYVRAVTVLAGGTNPNHAGECRLVSNGSFRIRTVS